MPGSVRIRSLRLKSSDLGHLRGSIPMVMGGFTGSSKGGPGSKMLFNLVFDCIYLLIGTAGAFAPFVRGSGGSFFD